MGYVDKSSVLIIGPQQACAAATATLRSSHLTAGHEFLAISEMDQALSFLVDTPRFDIALLAWTQDAGADLLNAVSMIQERQRNPLMALLVRCQDPLPTELADALWEQGVADRQFGQPVAEWPASIAVALRASSRHRVSLAVAEVSSRLAKTETLGELADLALQALLEQGFGRQGAAFCLQRSLGSPQLVGVVGKGEFSALDCTPLPLFDNQRAARFARTAWDNRHSWFAEDLAALYIGTPSQSQPALILLLLDKPLPPWQRSALDTFAAAIAPAVEEHQLAQQLMRTQRAMISTLATVAEYKDNDTGEHVARVGRITAEIASHLEKGGNIPAIDGDFIKHIGHASILHDVGKIAVPEHVLLKPGPLDASEREIINSHVLIGQEILKKATALASHGDARLFGLASEIARSHHERYDGSGYPDGLRGEAIPLSARIVAVVDVFDALISHRPYKQPWSVEQALELIRKESGHHFDPLVVDAFLAVQERKASAKYIQWAPHMSIGEADLDRDHQRLITILNHLGIGMELGNRGIVEFILDDLSDYARVHFHREEQYLAERNFPGLAQHRQIHDAIVGHIENAKWKYFQGFSSTLENELLHFLTDWLNDHILVEDMKYKDFVAAAAL